MRFALALAGLLLASGPAGIRPPGAPVDQCPTTAWSSPSLLEPLGAEVARFPSLTTDGKQLIVVGDNLQSMLEIPVRRQLLVSAYGDENTGRPVGDFLFGMPIALYDGGQVNVVWAEPSPTDTANLEWPPNFRSLWWARHSSHGGWSSAHRIYDARDILWGENRNSTGVVSQDGTLAIIAPVSHPTTHGVVILRFNGRAWQAHEIATKSYASYAAILVDSLDRMTIALVDAWGVQAFRSPDGGETFAGPVQVSRLGERDVVWVSLAHGTGRRVHVVWARNTRGGMFPDVLNHASSDDGGVTWSETHSISVADDFFRPEIVADGQGRIHVVYEDWLGGGHGGHLDYVCWDGRWSAPEHLFPMLRAQTAALLAGKDGILRVVFAASGDTTGSPLRTMLTKRQLR